MDAGGGSWALHWEYRCAGDYDQDGTVGVPDITPLAIHYNHNPGTDGMDIVIHPSGVGPVGISDVTPIAINFGVKVSSYVIKEGTSDAGPWTDVAAPLLSELTVTNTGSWLDYSYTFTPSVGFYYRVVPRDGNVVEGEESLALLFAGGGGISPFVLSVDPVTGLTGASYSPVVNYGGDLATEISWDFGGGASPNTIVSYAPTVTLGSPGDYNASVTVVNPYGTDTFNFILAVTTPTPTWTTYQVVPFSGVGGFVSFAKVFGKPAFAYINPTYGTVHYVQAIVINPANSSEWVDMLADESTARWYDGNISLTEDQYYTPVIMGWDSISGNAYYLGSNLNEPIVPSDWDITAITPADEAGSLTMANGHICAAIKKLDGLHYYEPTSYPPTGPADWTDCLVDTTPGAGGNAKIMWNSEEDGLYIFSYNYSTQGLYLSHCLYPDRLVSLAWSGFIASVSSGNEAGLYYDFGFDPAAMSNNLLYIYTSNEIPGVVLNEALGYEGASDASSFTFGWAASGTGENHGRMCSMAFGGGDLMAAYQGNDTTQLILNRTPFTTNVLPFTWTPEVVPSPSSSPVASVHMLNFNETSVRIIYGRDDGIYYAELPLT